MKKSEVDNPNKLKKREIVLDHINYLKKNLNPLDKKGDEYKKLHYNIDDYDVLNCLFDALVMNTSYKGELMIDSIVYDDNIGYKISKIIGNNNITFLKIGNRNKPFSDRIAKEIGEALELNTVLTELEVFLNVDDLAPLSLCKFLKNPDSSLKSFSFLKLNKELFVLLSDNFNKKSKLESLKFYYEPLRSIDLCYKPLIEQETYFKLADKIQNESNLTTFEIIPLYEDYEIPINEKLNEDNSIMLETLKFACEMNQSNPFSKIDIDRVFNKENQRKNLIL